MPIGGNPFLASNIHTLNDIQLAPVWKLSHAVRQCARFAQNESAETHSVTMLQTKSGVTFAWCL